MVRSRSGAGPENSCHRHRANSMARHILRIIIITSDQKENYHAACGLLLMSNSRYLRYPPVRRCSEWRGISLAEWMEMRTDELRKIVIKKMNEQATHCPLLLPTVALKKRLLVCVSARMDSLRCFYRYIELALIYWGTYLKCYRFVISFAPFQ